MSNRLSSSSSPYLLQHADNPVDWYEWGDDAFAAARLRDLPILLSVGYATCHWCHVMAHESFEDPETATYMNGNFINVKVDREERPDVDRVYMDAVQAMTGHGGWPMTVFLTPDGEPFLAGTYFPKEERGGYPSFRRVMNGVVDAWSNRRGDLAAQAAKLTTAIRAEIPSGQAPDVATVAGAVEAIAANFDWEHGGFGGAPKFPQAPVIELLLRVLAVDLLPDRRGQVMGMIRTTLDAMAAGGIYDQLGGGFARYSVDRAWLVPHFEKMLYDNALLARLYLRAWQVTGSSRYLTVATETLDYMLRDLADPDGGFHSGEDADSEGSEGTFYVWRWDELTETIGDDLPLVAAAFGASPQGNFEDASVLSRPIAWDVLADRFDLGVDEVRHRVADARGALFARRALRPRPAVDDKIVTAWNGLALRAFAEAGAVLGESRYRAAAERLALFATGALITADGGLVRTWRRGKVGPPGFCDDYAALAIGLFMLYQATGERTWYDHAEQLTRAAIERFGGDDGFFATEAAGGHLIARPKNLMDNPTPSDNSLMAEALQMLHAYTADSDVSVRLDGTLRAAGWLAERHPSAVGHLLAVLSSGASGPKEVAIVGDRRKRSGLEAVVWERFRPDVVLAPAEGPDPAVPLLAERTADGAALAYVCEGFHCELPVGTPEALRAQLDRPVRESPS